MEFKPESYKNKFSDCFIHIFYLTNLIFGIFIVREISDRFLFPSISPSNVSSLTPAYSSLTETPAISEKYIRTPFKFNGPIAWESLPEGIQEQYKSSTPECSEGPPSKISIWFDNGGINSNIGNIPPLLKPYVVWNNELFKWFAAGIQNCIEKAKAKDQSISPYADSTNLFYRALAAFPIKGKKVLVGGSISPWVECIVLAHGAGNVTTTDWNVPDYDGDDLSFTHASEINTLQEESFDAIFSYSSLEHDGLGRYGDPLDPNGDLKAMREMSRALKPGGLLFLGVPIGEIDHTQFNVHRIYGRCRWKLMMDGWEILGSFGKFDEVEGSVDWKAHFKNDDWSNQPIFVMKKTHEPNHTYI